MWAAAPFLPVGSRPAAGLTVRPCSAGEPSVVGTKRVRHNVKQPLRTARILRTDWWVSIAMCDPAPTTPHPDDLTRPPPVNRYLAAGEGWRGGCYPRRSGRPGGPPRGRAAR